MCYLKTHPVGFFTALLTFLLLLKLSIGISIDYAKTFIKVGRSECSTLDVDSHLFGGSLSEKSYGFMVLIVRVLEEEYPEMLCGASLVDEIHILTAGHCVQYIQEKMDDMETIEAWIAPKNFDRFRGQKIPIIKIIRHEDFKPRPLLHNDIGIATLKEPVEFSWGIQTICIGVGDYHKQQVRLIGFGNYDCYNDSNDLRVASGLAFNIENCKSKGHHGALNDSQICAKLVDENNEPAEQAIGDSGGPLFLNDPLAEARIRSYTQVGIVSYNYIKNGSKDLQGFSRDPCPNLKIPGTYTRLASYVDFIKKHAPNARLCF